MSGKKDRKEYIKDYKGPGPSLPVRKDDILKWLEGLAKNDQIEIFSMEIDIKRVILDDETEEITILRKGATLKRIDEIHHEEYLLIKDVKRGVKYISEIHVHNEMTFKKIAGDLDLRKIKKDSYLFGSYLKFPEEVVIIEELRVVFDYENNETSLWRKKYLISDELLIKIESFIEDKAKQVSPIYINERDFIPYSFSS